MVVVHVVQFGPTRTLWAKFIVTLYTQFRPYTKPVRPTALFTIAKYVSWYQENKILLKQTLFKTVYCI